MKLIRHALSDERFRECYKEGKAHEYTQHQKEGFSRGDVYWVTFISDGGIYARLHSLCPVGLPACEAKEYRGENAFSIWKRNPL